MSRSHRKTPKIGVAGGKSHISEKFDKAVAHRKIRKSLKAARSSFEMATTRRLIQDPWIMSKDGKFTFDPLEDPHLMRK